jgi:hypothetical protein
MSDYEIFKNASCGTERGMANLIGEVFQRNGQWARAELGKMITEAFHGMGNHSENVNLALGPSCNALMRGQHDASLDVYNADHPTKV